MKKLWRGVAVVAIAAMASVSAYAAEWGAIQKGQCNLATGQQAYSAKIWTGLGDRQPKVACASTPAMVAGVSRPPNACEDHGLGIVYGVWYVTNDPACQKPGQVIQKQIIPNPVREVDDANAPLTNVFAGTGVTLQDLRDSVERAVGDFKEIVSKWSDELSGNTEMRAAQLAASKEILADPEIARLRDLAHALMLELNSDSADAVAARKAILAGEAQNAVNALQKLPTFTPVTMQIERGKVANVISIGVAGDGQVVVGANAEIGLAIGTNYASTDDNPADLETAEFGGLFYASFGYSAGAAAGLDGAVQVGIWKTSLDQFPGDANGFVFGGAASVGGAAGIWWAYEQDRDDSTANDKQIFKWGLAEFIGVTVAPQFGVSVEIEYDRTVTVATTPWTPITVN